MATWDDLQSEVFKLTNRPKLVTETQMALKSAIRAAHRQGKFWRDVTEADIAVAEDTVQVVDLTVSCPRYRQVAYVKVLDEDHYLDPAEANDLIDRAVGIMKEDIYWATGTQLNIRCSAPAPVYTIGWYQQPIVTPPENIDSWLLDEYREVVVLYAAVTVLGAVGEESIRKTLEGLLGVAVRGLVADNTEGQGR